jgi:hypothetical protein
MLNPYKRTSIPTLVPSLVCYADVLGYYQLSKSSIKEGKGQLFLETTHKAFTRAYDQIRKHRKEYSDESHYAVKIFTDNIVIGYPLQNPERDLGEPEFADVLRIFFEFQLGLALEGLLIRGGVALGGHYMDNDIVFGDALLEAVDQDKSGGPPRITLAPSAVQLVRHHISFYGEVSNSPHYIDLLEDSDGEIFLNYLNLPFEEFPDGEIFFEPIIGHFNVIKDGLLKYRSCPDVRAKYEWAARYHNYICHDYINRYPEKEEPSDDGYYDMVSAEAQKLINYIINIEELSAGPNRITLKPL